MSDPIIEQDGLPFLNREYFRALAPGAAVSALQDALGYEFLPELQRGLNRLGLTQSEASFFERATYEADYEVQERILGRVGDDRADLRRLVEHYGRQIDRLVRERGRHLKSLRRLADAGDDGAQSTLTRFEEDGLIDGPAQEQLAELRHPDRAPIEERFTSVLGDDAAQVELSTTGARWSSRFAEAFAQSVGTYPLLFLDSYATAPAVASEESSFLVVEIVTGDELDGDMNVVPEAVLAASRSPDDDAGLDWQYPSDRALPVWRFEDGSDFVMEQLMPQPLRYVQARFKTLGDPLESAKVYIGLKQED